MGGIGYRRYRRRGHLRNLLPRRQLRHECHKAFRRKGLAANTHFPPSVHFPIPGIRYYFSKFFPSEFFLIIASVHDLPGCGDMRTGAGWN